MVDDADSGGAKALLAPTVNTSRIAIARSLADAAPGEMVAVNRRGQTITPRRFRAMRAASWATLVAGGGLLGVFYGYLFSPLIGVVAGIGVQLVMLFKMRHWPAFRAAMAETAASRWESAHSAFLELERKRLPANQRREAQVMLAGLESMIGQPQQALDRLARVESDLSARRRGTPLVRCHRAAIRARALATLGRFEEAWRARDEMVREAAAASGAAGRKAGDFLEMMVQSTQLQIAAAADTPEALPDDDTLHQWARAALGRTKFGEMLVSLAWVFHRRGDDEMARHLLAEAPSRTPRSALEKTSPRLASWAKEMARAWDIEA